MKAIVYDKYGPADVLHLGETATPEPEENEIRVKIYEALATPTDVASRLGKPFMIRLFTGLFRPKGVLGTDFAGIVDAVGPSVTEFTVGDQVFGAVSDAFGTYAEYICVPEDSVVTTMPSSMTFREVAGTCDGGLTALYFLRDGAKLQAGQHILINGASGGVGTFAVQLAKYFGAHVTGVCGPSNLDLVKSLGADDVIDYTKADFTKAGEQYDVIFDAVGKSSFTISKRALKPGGIYLGTTPRLTLVLHMFWTALFGSKKAKFMASGLMQTKQDLIVLKELYQSGDLKTVIDACYPLEEAAAAHQLVESGHKSGQVVLIVTPA